MSTSNALRWTLREIARLELWSAPPTLGLDDDAAKALVDEAMQADDSDRLTFLQLAWVAAEAG